MGRVWASDPPDHHLVTSRGVWQDAVRAYLAGISYADELVGRIISALDTSPARDETAIVLCGDNGFHLGEKLHWRKFALWEEATRVPLIIVPPGSRQASRPAVPVSLIDVFPMILQFAGLNGRSCDGVSLYDRMMGDAKAAIHQAPIMTWGKGNHSIRDGRWRYTTYNDGGEELYDHAADPHGWTNLAANPLEKDQMERLHLEIRRRCKRG
jgi:arylsulfatase A-like enzyme